MRTLSFVRAGIVMAFAFACLLTADAVPAAGPLPPGAPGDVAAYAPPTSHRLSFCLNYDWRFAKKDVQKSAFDDAAWTAISLPHTFNDVDSFREWRSHDNSRPQPADIERFFEGKVWYRKHFTLDPAWRGRKLFLEFEHIRNTGRIFLNGTLVGEHGNQIGPCGVDITAAARFDGENVLAVQVDSNMLAKNPDGFSYGWSADAFYPRFGGLPRGVALHIADRLYQTLPLYSNLGTSGTYVYAERIDTLNRTADITVEAEVANDYAEAKSAVFTAWIIDRAGKEIFRKALPARAFEPGAKVRFSVGGALTGLHLWEPDYPYLYRVYTSLTLDGRVIDVYQTPLGVRKVTFSATDGLKINGHPIYLKGYAPRTTMEWAVTGIPQDWMNEYDYLLMKANNANFVRPMHVAPRRNQVDAADKLGIILACPAGNGEGDDPDRPEGNSRWKDRVQVMRDVTIYFRNNPSVVFWEASNSGITAAHMRDMVEVRKTWDPHGGRFAGTRSTDQASMSVREYGSPMDVPARTALMPYWDAEYARAEAPRRIWDKYTPFLDYGGKFVTGGYLTVASPAHVAATKAKGGDGIYEYPQDAFRLNSSEDLALNNLMKYWDRYKTSAFVAPAQDRLTRGIMVGGAKIIFADSNSHGRMMDMEVSRVTGALDAVRLPKEAYHALTVAHGTQPAVHIIGHWNYLADTVKPMWIACNAEKVKLATYGEDGQLIKDYGWAVRDEVNAQYGKVNQYAFQVKNVAWQPGKIEAIAYNGDQEVARHAVETSGAPAALKLTPVMNPGPWHADGADIAIVDVEVMDAQGRRCPTDEARVDFASAGDAGAFLGGYNSGIRHSTNRPYLNIECGINRVFVRATRTAGDFTITVTRDGLKPSSLTLTSLAVASPNGLSTVWPRHFGYALGAEPTPAADNTPARVVRTPPSDAAPTDVMREFAYTGTNGPLLDPPMPAAHVEHSLRNGAQVYVDKAWTFDALPAYLLGGDYVQGFARDATETTSTDTIQFYTNRPCVLFMLVDEANKQPVHLNSVDFIWRKLPETVTVGGRKHAIYRSRALTAGHNGYFPSNGFGVDVAPGSNQYIMVAVPAP